MSTFAENHKSERMYSVHSQEFVRQKNVLITFAEKCKSEQMYSVHSAKSVFRRNVLSTV